MNIIPIIQGDSQTDVNQCLTARRFQEDSKKIQGPGGGGPNLPEKRRPEPWTRKSTSTDQDARSITTIITMLKDMNRHKSKWHNMRQYNTMLWDAKLSNILGFWVPRKRMYTNVNSQMKYSKSQPLKHEYQFNKAVRVIQLVCFSLKTSTGQLFEVTFMWRVCRSACSAWWCNDAFHCSESFPSRVKTVKISWGYFRQGRQNPMRWIVKQLQNTSKYYCNRIYIALIRTRNKIWLQCDVMNL